MGDLLLAETIGLGPADRHGADRLTGAQHGDGDLASRAQRLDHLPGQPRDAFRAIDVGDIGGLSRRDDAAHDGVLRRRSGEYPLQLFRSGGTHSVPSHDMDEVSVVAIDTAEATAAQAYRALHDDLEDRLDVGRRAGDDAKDLA